MLIFYSFLKFLYFVVIYFIILGVNMGKFNIVKSEIEGVFTVEPTVFADERGYFMETYNENDFKEEGIDLTFVQDNQSKSSKGVLRGLHFQYTQPQGKLVRVIKGEVFDVGVDLRKDSQTYGKWVGEILSEENKKQLDDEGGIQWNDPEIGIEWPLGDLKEEDIILSEKDKLWKPMKETPTDF